MLQIIRPIGLAVAATTLVGFTPTETYSASQLALIDPSLRMASLCSGKAGPQSMRARLAITAAVIQAAPTTAVPLHDDLGKVDFKITTSNPLAQRYFNQGLSYAYGFNHGAAIASFRQAQQLDPSCAMCWWGEAMAHGPNINAPMDPEANARAIAAAKHAQSLARKATPAEQAIADAMIARYSADSAADRAALDAAYADAMLKAAEAHPDNDDIALLAAEAAMDTAPWAYWEADRKTPKPRLGEAVRLVETVWKRNSDHPQAPHLYIHLMENGPDPKMAEAAADRLARPLAGGAGHLVHMPAHIYYRLGRWKDSIRTNIAAARVDEAYLKESGERGMVRYGYYPHNVHFIVSSAQMAGDMPTAIREARKLATIVDTETGAKIAWTQAIHAAPYFAAVQFATPRKILAMSAPDARLPYVTAMRHYARASAYAALRNPAGFDREVGIIERMRQDTALFKTMIDQGVPAPDLLQLAESVARARFATARGRHDEAIRLYRQAAEIEGRIPYMEPPYWYYPVDQSLGAAYYRAGRFDDARQAFTSALAKSPNNGWALYGLAASERALGRKPFAAAAQAALDRAWAGDPKWLKMDRL